MGHVSRSVRISGEFHEFATAHKREDETMEETLRRLIGGSHPEDVAGTLSSETAAVRRDRLENKRETDFKKERTAGAVRVIRDTSFLTDPFDGREAAFENGIELSETKTVRRVPSPVVVELSYGAEFGNEDERRNVRNALRMYPVVEQNETIAHRAGQLLARADRSSDGESGIDNVGPMVAAVSDIYDEPVLTDNVEDFAALGVGVETY